VGALPTRENLGEEGRHAIRSDKASITGSGYSLAEGLDEDDDGEENDAS
jgi:hypothetical protein